MTTSDPLPFLQAVDAVLATFKSHRKVSPARLLDQWREFVGNSAEGYRWPIEEFLNERSVRDVIEGLLNDPVVMSFTEGHEWAERVREADERYHALLVQIPGRESQRWWASGVPSKAGPELAEDIANLYHVNIEIVD